MSEFFTAGLAGWVIGKAGELIWSAGGNVAHDALKEIWRASSDRLAEGQLPPNHDIDGAVARSAAQAARFLAYCLHDPGRRELTTLLGSLADWPNFAHRLVEVLQRNIIPETPEDWWLQELIEATKGRDAFKDFAARLAADVPVRLLHGQLDAELQRVVPEEFLKWTRSAVRVNPNRPPTFERCVRDGWKFPLGSGQKITFFEVFCIFFREEVKKNEIVFRAFMARLSADLDQKLDVLLARSASEDGRNTLRNEAQRLRHLSNADFERVLNRHNEMLVSALIPQFDKLHSRHDAHDSTLGEIHAGLSGLHKKIDSLRTENSRAVTAQELAELLGARAMDSNFNDLIKVVRERIFKGAKEHFEPSLNPPAKTENRDERENLGRLLDRVEGDWIKGVLDQSLHRLAWMGLGLNWQDDAVQQPWDRVRLTRERPPIALSSQQSIATIFQEAQETLLILGEPGAGKTTTLLELARELITQARTDATKPVPVVLTLSNWTGEQRGFKKWAIEELNRRYLVPKRLGRAWVRDNRLIFLLDGLDEVAVEKRLQCVQAINQLVTDEGVSGIAVSCRAVEYATIEEKLRLRAAICLRPLSQEQVDEYLVAGGTALSLLRSAIADDKVLQELAATPLLLGVMVFAFQGRTSLGLQAGPVNAETRRAELFDAYIQAALHRPGKQRTDGEDKITVQQLARLAEGMQQRGQTLFNLEQIQPAWLDTWQQRAFYLFATRILGVSMVAILGIMFAFAVIFNAQDAPLPSITVGYLLLVGVTIGGTIAVMDLALFRLPLGLQNAGIRFWLILGALTIHASVFGIAAEVLDERLPRFIIFMVICSALAFASTKEVAYKDIRGENRFVWSWRKSLGITWIWAYSFGWSCLVGDFVQGWFYTKESFRSLWDHGGVWGGIIGGGIGLFGWFQSSKRPQWRLFLRALTLAVTGWYISGMLGEFPYAHQYPLYIDPATGLPSESDGISFGFRIDSAMGFPRELEEMAGPVRSRSEIIELIILWCSVIFGMVFFPAGINASVAGVGKYQKRRLWDWARPAVWMSVIIAFMAFGLFEMITVGNDVISKHQPLPWEDGDTRQPAYGWSDFVSLLKDDIKTGWPIVISAAGIIALRLGLLDGVQHYLLRWLLIRNRTLPHKPRAFLENAANLSLLQRVGTGYRFIHRQVQEHFAKMSVHSDAKKLVTEDCIKLQP